MKNSMRGDAPRRGRSLLFGALVAVACWPVAEVCARPKPATSCLHIKVRPANPNGSVLVQPVVLGPGSGGNQHDSSVAPTEPAGADSAPAKKIGWRREAPGLRGSAQRQPHFASC